MRDVITCRSCWFNSFFFIAQTQKQQMVLLHIFVWNWAQKVFIFILYGEVGGGGGGGVVGDFSFVRLRKVAFNKGLMPARVWRFHSATVVSVSVSALVALSLPKSQLSGGPAVAFCRCHSLPKIDELIVGLLPVCLCPGRRCPGYGWESQLWHPPWGYYCNRPTGGLWGGGAAGPRRSPDPHTAVTPLETK